MERSELVKRIVGAASGSSLAPDDLIPLLTTVFPKTLLHAVLTPTVAAGDKADKDGVLDSISLSENGLLIGITIFRQNLRSNVFRLDAVTGVSLDLDAQHLTLSIIGHHAETAWTVRIPRGSKDAHAAISLYDVLLTSLGS